MSSRLGMERRPRFPRVNFESDVSNGTDNPRQPWRGVHGRSYTGLHRGFKHLGILQLIAHCFDIVFSDVPPDLSPFNDPESDLRTLCTYASAPMRPRQAIARSGRPTATLIRAFACTHCGGRSLVMRFHDLFA